MEKSSDFSDLGLLRFAWKCHTECSVAGRFVANKSLFEGDTKTFIGLADGDGTILVQFPCSTTQKYESSGKQISVDWQCDGSFTELNTAIASERRTVNKEVSVVLSFLILIETEEKSLILPLGDKREKVFLESFDNGFALMDDALFLPDRDEEKRVVVRYIHRDSKLNAALIKIPSNTSSPNRLLFKCLTSGGPSLAMRFAELIRNQTLFSSRFYLDGRPYLVFSDAENTQVVYEDTIPSKETLERPEIRGCYWYNGKLLLFIHSESDIEAAMLISRKTCCRSDFFVQRIKSMWVCSINLSDLVHEDTETGYYFLRISLANGFEFNIGKSFTKESKDCFLEGFFCMNDGIMVPDFSCEGALVIRYLKTGSNHSATFDGFLSLRPYENRVLLEALKISSQVAIDFAGRLAEDALQTRVYKDIETGVVTCEASSLSGPTISVDVTGLATLKGYECIAGKPMEYYTRPLAKEKRFEHLHLLLDEVDAFCKAHDIQYFIGAGTMLGAFRHKGFIPWDHDMDLFMTEDNYNKFIETAKKEFPEDRTLLGNRIYPRYPSSFCRYTDKNTTRMANTGVKSYVWDVCGKSSFIDIFALMPLPKDSKGIDEAVEDFFLYDEYENELFLKSPARAASFKKKWLELQEREKSEKKEDLVAELENKVFNRTYPDSEYYLLSAASKRLVYKKDHFDGTAYLPFEGSYYPVPAKYIEHLRFMYGEDFRNYPQGKTTETAKSKKARAWFYESYTMPYSYFFNEYQSKIDTTAMLNERHLLKMNQAHAMLHRSDVQLRVRQMQSAVIVTKIKRTIEAKNLSIPKLLKSKRYARIASLFNKYYALQTLHGSKKWGLFVELPIDWYYPALLALLISRKETGTVSTILSICKANDVWTEDLQRLSEGIKAVGDTLMYRDYHEYEAMAIALKSAKELLPDSVDVANAELFLKHHAAKNAGDVKEIRKELETAVKDKDCSGEAIKLYADTLMFCGEKDKALAVYHLAAEELADGVLRQEISEILEGYRK